MNGPGATVERGRRGDRRTAQDLRTQALMMMWTSAYGGRNDVPDPPDAAVAPDNDAVIPVVALFALIVVVFTSPT